MKKGIIRTRVENAFRQFNDDLDIKKLIQSIADIADFSVRYMKHRKILDQAIKDAYLLSDWELIKKYAEKEGYIPNLWSIEDVKSTAIEKHKIKLTDEQAWEILNNIKNSHDATIGINWDVIECHIDLWISDLSYEEKEKLERIKENEKV